MAISNDRLLRIEGDRVYFRFKDYKNGGEWEETSLEAIELVRRFLLHVLPDRFVRIRYYGLLANRYRAENLERCRELLGVPSEPEGPDTPEEEADETWEERLLRLTGIDPIRCPVCGQGRLSLHQRVEPQPHRPEHEEALPASRAPP